MTPCWTRDLCIWHTEWLHVGLVICVSDIIQNDGMLDLWSVYLTLYRMMMDSWSVYLPLYRMTTCWTRDLCICHYTEWQHVGLAIYVSGIIQNDVGLVIGASDIIQNDAMLDSWSVYLTYRMTPCRTRDLCIWQYRMTACWTCDLCIWHDTEWWWTRDLCICHYTEWQHVGLVICVSDILQNDAMLDSWSVYLTFYRMTPCWTHDLCIWHYTEWLHVGLVICIWHYIEWRHVGLVICVYDIIHDDAMLDSWSVYLTFYKMTPCWTCDLCIWHYTEWCWTRDLCIWHYTEWRHVGLVICVSDIIQNDGMLDLWSVYLTLYRMTTCWTRDLYLHYTEWCWTRDLCIWHYTEWRHVDSWSVYLIQNDSM